MNKHKPTDSGSMKRIIYDESNVDELNKFINDKIVRLQEIIRNTMISIKTNYQYEIFSNTEMNICINILNDAYTKTNEISILLSSMRSQSDFDTLIENLQKIINKISIIICGYGTNTLDDLLFICFGSEFINIHFENEILQDKYDLIKQFVRPIGYKLINWKPPSKKGDLPKELCSNKLLGSKINVDDANILECFDVSPSSKSFYQKIYGLRIIIQNDLLRKKIVVNGIVVDINLDCISNKYIRQRKATIIELHSHCKDTEKEVIQNIVSNMTMKEVLTYGNVDVFKRMQTIFEEIQHNKNTKIELVVKRFLEMDVFDQRNMIINLSLYIKDENNQYVSYLLYELLSMNVLDNNENTDHKYLYDSLPYNLKKYFKEVVTPNIMKNTDVVPKGDKNKVSFEHQIQMLKTGEGVKEKAMVKLKEIRGRTDDTCIKAKQYLEGLLKIPFGIYKEEPILRKIKEYNRHYLTAITVIEKLFPGITVSKKEKYTTMEITNNIKYIENYVLENISKIVETKVDTQTLKTVFSYITEMSKSKGWKKMSKGKTKADQRTGLVAYLKDTDIKHSYEIYDVLNDNSQMNVLKTMNDVGAVKSNIKSLNKTMDTIYDTMDESIYGHKYAKNQIMKIIAQWMNGEQSGYCFGFEGPPGIGKTSLAKKGLANCLKDDMGESRPFAFIALGGSCNGSYLEGHSYTYINSNWGRITDILMQSKCMNPIIYIDELDKVSKTESGKEIIGILTHMIDQTQNDVFQDKFFSGIDIDLSKALFIFSYNDVKQIDPILLDRIHRIKFESLSVSDKIVIVTKYILPEINKKMGFENVVELSDEIIQYIIDTYTAESGVRKLKEILFDLFGEINLEIIRNRDDDDLTLPIQIKIENLDTYLERYPKLEEKYIHKKPEMGIINGLWASVAGKGGITPIECRYFPTTSFFELKLTGLQGEVMKESMNVAKTLAWNLTLDEVKTDLIQYFEKTKCQGLHIHCPEGAVSKDGPSAGVAITCAIYSLLNKRPIRNDVAITGEVTLQGDVTAIGGLDLKIAGGIRAGVKTFLYPKSNNKDFVEWKKKVVDIDVYKDIEFIEMTNIKEALEKIFT